MPRSPPGRLRYCDIGATATQLGARNVRMLETASFTEHDTRVGPGLVADVVYLRPAHRPPLLGILAELGVFIRETPGFPSCDSQTASELIIAMADASERSQDAVRKLAASGATVIAIVDDPHCTAQMHKAGASAVVSESASPAMLRSVLNTTGRSARERRATVVPALEKVFGHLEFRASPPEFAAGSKVAPLSPVEFEVMKLFARFRGELVPREVLHASLRRNDEEISDGYLKTVVLRIRRKAESLGGDPGVLHAVRGMGYILRG